MVTHKRLQQYKHYYCKTVVTGLFGGRWHRYQQSKDETRKRDLIWVALSLVTFLHCTFWLYFWIIVGNSHGNFNEYMYRETGRWMDWYTAIVGVSATFYIYMQLLMILLVMHIVLHHELYMHWGHRIVIFLLTLWNISMTIVIQNSFSSGWHLLYISFQATGPFLQFVAVFICTLMAWPFGSLWASMYSIKRRAILVLLYSMFVLFLYLSPLLLDSPCIRENIPEERPQIIAHRGGAKLAPENTLEAIQKTLQYEYIKGIETDIYISYDGIPFLLHDKTLTRTTNIAEVYPERKNDDPAMFLWEELSSLNAGKWFLQKDPFGTAGSLSSTEREAYQNISLPRLNEILPTLVANQLTIMFDLQITNTSHPFYHNQTIVIEEEFVKANVDPKKVMYLYHGIHNYTQDFSLYMKYGNKERLMNDSISPEKVKQSNYSAVHLEYSNMWWTDMNSYRDEDIETSVYVVDSVWLYSLYWCANVSMVTSNGVDTLAALTKPKWHMTPELYRAVWITVDVLSLLISVAIFVIHKIHHGSQKYHPETTVLSIQATRERMLALKKGRTMREKLLRSTERLSELDNHGVVGIHIGMDDISERNSVYALENDSLEGSSVNLQNTLQQGKLSFITPATVHMHPDQESTDTTSQLENNNKLNSENNHNPWTLGDDDPTVCDAEITNKQKISSDDKQSDMWDAADKMVQEGFRKRASSLHSTHTIESVHCINDNPAGTDLSDDVVKSTSTPNISRQGSTQSDGQIPSHKTELPKLDIKAANLSQPSSPQGIQDMSPVFPSPVCNTTYIYPPQGGSSSPHSATVAPVSPPAGDCQSPSVIQSMFNYDSTSNLTDTKEKTHITRIAVV